MAEKARKQQSNVRINPAGAFWLGIACFALAGAVGSMGMLNQQYLSVGIASGLLMLAGAGWGWMGTEKAK